jgi:hypothetical protein
MIAALCECRPVARQWHEPLPDDGSTGSAVLLPWLTPAGAASMPFAEAGESSVRFAPF